MKNFITDRLDQSGSLIDADSPNASVSPIVGTLLCFGVVGLIFLVLYSVHAGSLALFGVLSLLAFAAFCIGGLLGFLFGIPKYVAKLPSVSSAQGTPDVPIDAAPSYASNTNLEDMSDWLTKIIIGAGLVGLNSLREGFNTLVLTIAECFEDLPCAAAVIGADLVSFIILGFFAIYLLTRLYLANQLSLADRVLSQARRIERLAELDLVGLPPLQRAWLARLAVAAEQNSPFPLPSEFSRRSADHEALRSLRRIGLVEPVGGGSWQSGKVVELTPLGRSLLPEINRQLASEIQSVRAGKR